jgi:hypothetical protein
MEECYFLNKNKPNLLLVNSLREYKTYELTKVIPTIKVRRRLYVRRSDLVRLQNEFVDGLLTKLKNNDHN